MIRYCVLCGSGNKEGTLFCAACGTELVDDVMEEEVVATAGRTDTHSFERVPSPDGIVDENEMPLMVLADGTVLKGVYQVSYLTCGGMGAIYKAIDLETRNEYVIKEAVSTDPTEKSRLMMSLSRERETLIRLYHPGIIRCHDFFEEGESWYLVLEYFDGHTLEEAQDAVKPGFLSEMDVLNWSVQLAEIIDYMHNLNPPIIYRDLKPSNAMVNHLGKIKLIDFGIARVHKKGRRGDTEIIGTVGFCPPEQYGDGQTDHCSDIYSLGAMIHSLLTNIVPGTQGSNPFEFCPARMINPNVSRQVEAIITKSTRIEREQRYETMEKFLMVLRGALQKTSEQRLGLPKLEVDPKDLDLMRIGFDEVKRARFLITNGGQGDLTGTISISKRGISVHPTTIKSNKQVVEISVDGAAMPAYKEQKITVLIKSNGGNFQLPVTFSVGLTPKLAISPAAMQFVLHNDQISFTKELVLINKGADILEGIVRAEEPWLILDQKEFRGNYIKIPIQIEPYNLYPGRSYNSKVIANTNGGTRDVMISVFLKLTFSHFEDTLAHIPQGDERIKLSQMLRDMRAGEPRVRNRLVQELSEHKHRELFLSHFMEAMERDLSMEVRETCAAILYKIARKESVPSFIEVLGDKSPKVRRIAAQALGDVGDENAVEYLIKLVTDEDPEVRQAARSSISVLAPKKASATLAPIADAVKNFDMDKATKKLKDVQNAARGFWNKLINKDEQS